jgi:hypothetical protein
MPNLYDLLRECRAIRPNIYAVLAESLVMIDGYSATAYRAKGTGGMEWLGDTPNELIQDVRENEISEAA